MFALLFSHQFFSTRSPPWPHIQLLSPSSSLSLLLSLSHSYSLTLALTPSPLPAFLVGTLPLCAHLPQPTLTTGPLAPSSIAPLSINIRSLPSPLSFVWSLNGLNC